MIVRVWVILYVQGGCVQEPWVETDEIKAEKKFEQYVIDQGFRARKEDESFEHYFESYDDCMWKWDDFDEIPEGCENFDPDDEVHMYEYEIMTDNGRL